jgi:hypothetical protein
MTKILSIDPGNVTGIAWFDTRWPDKNPTVEEIPGGLFGFIDWWQCNVWKSPDAWHKRPSRVFVEDFIIRPDTHKKTREPAAYELLGWIKGRCYEHAIPCSPIGPAEHTPFSEYKLKKKSKIVRLGWSAPSKDMHADSAMSILLLGLKRDHYEVAAELLKGIVL